MIAALPMYWRRENAEDWRAMWRDVQAVAQRHGLQLPDLTAPEDIDGPWTEHWLREDLILSQTCSMPFRTTLRDKVTYVGTFDFGLDTPTGHYYSEFVTQHGTHDIRRLAINGTDSQSGFAVGFSPLVDGDETTHYAERAAHVETGAHVASIQCVAEGHADGAYIDAVTYQLSAHYDPTTDSLTKTGRTPPTPGLPLVTARGTNPAMLRSIFFEVFAAEPRWIGSAALGGLRGFVVLDEEKYINQPIPTVKNSDVG